jgi:hypothetical protein
MMTSRSNQPEMPGFEAVGAVDEILGEKREKVWYYVYKPRTQRMLATNDEGDWVWIEHDCAHQTPHLFSSRKLAMECRQYGCRTRVKQYPYRVR